MVGDSDFELDLCLPSQTRYPAADELRRCILFGFESYKFLGDLTICHMTAAHTTILDLLRIWREAAFMYALTAPLWKELRASEAGDHPDYLRGGDLGGTVVPIGPAGAGMKQSDIRYREKAGAAFLQRSLLF